MHQRISHHAAVRSQQRGIDAAQRDLLLSYGDRLYDGRGGVIRFFSVRSMQRVERALGGDALRKLDTLRRCYLVESTRDGTIITVGKRYASRRLRRP